jgi:hypothetical protein
MCHAGAEDRTARVVDPTWGRNRRHGFGGGGANSATESQTRSAKPCLGYRVGRSNTTPPRLTCPNNGHHSDKISPRLGTAVLGRVNPAP